MNLSKFIRRSHMYLALFFMPWVAVYALSTLALNHRSLMISYYGALQPPFDVEQERSYQPDLPADASPKAVAEHILTDLGLEGSYNVRGGVEGGPITIVRHHPTANRRITYTPAEKKIVVERQQLRFANLLIALHIRAGYQREQLADDSWAFSIDLAIVGLIFWALSGLWMW